MLSPDRPPVRSGPIVFWWLLAAWFIAMAVVGMIVTADWLGVRIAGWFA